MCVYKAMMRAAVERLRGLTCQLFTSSPCVEISRSLLLSPSRLSGKVYSSKAFSTSVRTMAPTEVKTFDYIVVGGGSGGSGTARRAAGWYGAKTLLIENGLSGGCCVNVG